jgi:hypothetical protein
MSSTVAMPPSMDDKLSCLCGQVSRGAGLGRAVGGLVGRGSGTVILKPILYYRNFQAGSITGILST